MSDKKISYLNRTFIDYKNSLTELSEKYYPEISNEFNDASVGAWLIDMISAVADNLSYHIDRVYNETNIDSAQQASSIYALARSNGFKIPGPKGSMTEVVFKCIVPIGNGSNDPNGLPFPDNRYAPIIKRGTILSSGNDIFEVMEDVDFKEQFDSNNVSNLTVKLLTDSNDDPVGYELSKTTTVVAGQSKVYKQIMKGSDIKPFMEILIPETDIMNIESIIFKSGTNFKYSPDNNEFFINKEHISAEESPYGVETYRFFEVNSLLEQYRWGDDIDTNAEGNQSFPQSVRYQYGYFTENSGIVPTYSVTKGQWHPLTQKFTTEYTDKGYLKVIFGAGESVSDSEYMLENSSEFAKYQISKMVRNNSLGKLPPYGDGSNGWTMFIKYRSGGGTSSNIAANTLNNILYLDASIHECATTQEEIAMANKVRNSISVTNTISSI